MTTPSRDGDRPSTSERAVRDTAKQFAGQMVVGLFAVGFSAWLNRMLSPAELALWPIYTSLGNVVAACASFGMGDTFVRRVPALLVDGKRTEACDILRTGLLINLLACALLSWGVYTFAAHVARYLLHDPTPMTISVVRSMAFAVFLAAFSERLTWAMQAVQEFGKRSIINVVTGVLRTPLAVVLYLALGGVKGMIIALTITPGIACVLALWWLTPYLLSAWSFASPKRLLSFSLPFYGVSLLSLTSGRINSLVIALFAKPDVLATYFVASSITDYLRALDRFAIFSVTPKLAERSGKTPAAIGNVFTTCTRYALLGLLPLHVLVAVAAGPLLQLYGGDKYASSGPVLVVLSLGLFVTVLRMLHFANIQVFQRPVQSLKVSIVEGVSNVAGVALLVPPLGALGAALADSVVSVTQVIISALMLRQVMPLRYDWQAFRAASLATALSAGALWLMHPLWSEHALVVLPAFGVALIVYLLALRRGLDERAADLALGCIPRRLRLTKAGQRLTDGLRRWWVRQP